MTDNRKMILNDIYDIYGPLRAIATYEEISVSLDEKNYMKIEHIEPDEITDNVVRFDNGDIIT